MTILTYANNATTTLQSGISATQTTAVLATGTGDQFPPAGSSDQTFFLTFIDSATELVNEIVQVTNRAGDVITIARGQDNTSARAWGAGDIAAQLVTAADLAQNVQPDQLQVGTYGLGIGGGSANSITAAINSQLATIPEGFVCVIVSTAANTGAVTLTLTFGAHVQPAQSILKGAGGALSPGDIPRAGYPISLIYSAEIGAFIMNNPASGAAGSINGGAANELLLQTATNTTGFVPPPTIGGSILAFLGGVIQWAAAAVTSFNGRSGAVVPATNDYTPAQVGAVALAAFQAPNVQLGNPGFVVLPNGVIMQFGSQSIIANSEQPIFFPKIFPTQCVSVVLTANNNAAQVRSFATDHFTYLDNGSYLHWVAFGF